VTKHLGTLAYKVSIDGHVRKAHVDHMRPCVADKGDNGDTVTSVTDSMVDETNVQQETDKVANDVSECRARVPTKRLIEEIV